MSRNFASFVIIVVALSVASLSAETPLLSCGPNERLGNCGRICEQRCDDADLSRCAATSCQGEDCQCEPGFLRNNETDLCVLPSECPEPKCKVNEVVGQCGKICEGTCERPSAPEICRRIRCARSGCQCDRSRGYVRNSETGECVRNQDDKECAAKLRCPRHSAPALCGGVCESSCSDPEEIRCKLIPTNCLINCQCLNGYVRNELTEECIKRHQCLLGPT